MPAQLMHPEAGELKASRQSETALPEWRAWTLLAVLFSLAAISRQSLWIDEALTAMKAMQPDFHGWWAAMNSQKASDLQMPGYMLYIWLFAKVAGFSEWALRAANVPWFVAGFACAVRAIPGRRKIAMAIVMLFSPFAWYYLDEARPYAMQLGSSLMIFGSLYALSHRDLDIGWPEKAWLAIFLFATVALSSSSLLGMIWAGSGVVCALVVLKREHCLKLVRENPLTTIAAILLLMFLAGYYLWTLKAGARASDVGKTNLLSVGFIFYELLGFSGLGPGRADLRTGGINALRPYAMILIIYTVMTLDLLWLGLGKAFRKGSAVNARHLALALALPAVFILAAGLTQHFRVLGRHFTPLLPVLMLLLSLGLRERLVSSHWSARSITLLYLGFSLVSCLSFHLSERHGKDDYHDAADLAASALRQGKTVWWNASYEGGIYYGLPLDISNSRNPRLLYLMNPPASSLAALPMPDIVMESKPDVFDGGGAVLNYLASHNYEEMPKFKAFQVWKRRENLKK